ncbi:hypothetical protein BKA00_007457 [Actinomadura coerulea]|uniref:Uncharacterized protein n=1 Tax=Actinomadura coerulea TaxID=46159 RepID=A0A7X0G6W7_9ACTN|nr:phiSA1p31-related protein [Actinomadura coerulea]MBB6400543.1 hypothetical protein [Actinomadura coerulea]GGQ08000.1 hypothetical protein GCM10010187_25120 [Actinomadura coerulea]
MNRTEALKLAVEHVNSMCRPGPLGAGAPIERRAEAVERFARFLLEDDADTVDISTLSERPGTETLRVDAAEAAGFPLPGTRYRDNDGDVWIVRQGGGLSLDQPRNEGRNGHSTLAEVRSEWGPLTRLEDADPDRLTPGDRYRDGEGDVWTVYPDGLLYLTDRTPGRTLDYVREQYHSATKLEG